MDRENILVTNMNGYTLYKRKTQVGTWEYFYDDCGNHVKIWDSVHHVAALEAILKDLGKLKFDLVTKGFLIARAKDITDARFVLEVTQEMIDECVGKAGRNEDNICLIIKLDDMTQPTYGGSWVRIENEIWKDY